MATNTKSQFYLQQCIQAAEKSPMCFRLGAILVKGGKIYSRGFNHQRPQYDGPSSSRSYCTAVVSTSLSSVRAWR
jgi:deoxycytidylate deaminase